MTENKRFELAYEHDNWWAVRDGDITLWKEEVVDLLNELADENEQLKQQVEDLEFALRTELAHQRVEKKGEGFSDTVYDFQKKLEMW